MRQCEPCAYSSDGMLGAFYQPADEPAAGVVLLSPMFEERRSAHRCMHEFCSAAAGRDLAVLHPDLIGCGNSPGTLEEVSLDEWRRNLDAAVAFVREQSGVETVHLVGCRLGALLAGWYATESTNAIERTLLWSPVTAGKSYLSAARKRRMIQDSLTDAKERPNVDEREVEGQVLSETLFDELRQLNLTKLDKPGDVRLFQCSFNEKLTIDVQKLHKAWGEDVPTEAVVAQPFWNAHTPMGYDEIVAAAVELLLR